MSDMMNRLDGLCDIYKQVFGKEFPPDAIRNINISDSCDIVMNCLDKDKEYDPADFMDYYF